MTTDAFRVRVPGKAMLAGEYAVLAGAPGIVCALKRYLWCEAGPADEWSLEGAGHLWREDQPEPYELRFALEARRVAAAYLRRHGLRPKPLALKLTDDLRAANGAKLGLGGSACSTVAVVAAVLRGARRALEKDVVLKLAAIAHGSAQGRPGSALDIVAATYGGTSWARRFSVEPLRALAAAHSATWSAAVDRAGLPEMERLPDLAGLILAFSGRSASTAELIERVELYRTSSPAGFAAFLARTAGATDELRQALKAGDLGAEQAALRNAGAQLEQLGREAKVDLVTAEHREIARIVEAEGAVAKVSGAGGGDCSVVLASEEKKQAVLEGLRAAGIFAIEPGIDGDGVAIEVMPQ